MMPMFKTLSIEALGRILGVVMLVAFLLGVGASYYLSNMTSALEENWEQQVRTSVKKNAYLGLIRQAVGYGGMIHHLKNYVLRQNPQDLIDANVHILQIAIVTNAYSSLDINDEEHRALADIRATMLKYRDALPVAENLIAQGIAADKIDAQIRVDDSVATQALYYLEQIAYQQRERDQVDFRASLQRLTQFANIATLGTAVLFLFLMLFFGWGIRRRINLMYQREVEDNKHLADEKNRIDVVVNTIVDGIVTINAKGRILRVNHAVEGAFGYSARELIGQNVRLLMPDPYRSNHDRFLSQYLATGTAKIIGKRRELEAVRKDGSRFPIELAVTEMAVAGERQFVGVIRDITDRKENDKLKNQFIATVSHELRTPLTSIQGSLGMIATGALGEVPPKIENMLSIATNNTRRLVNLVNDLLDLEKLDAGKMSFAFKDIPLSEVIGNSYYSNMPFAEEFGINLEVEGKGRGLIVKADAKRLEQVITNLLSNAIKFSPKGSTVLLSFGGEGDVARVAVKDAGPGIADEFKGRIFAKFAQADGSDTRTKGGTGLGLSISKAIVEAHGGTIGFDSNPGAGSTFFFELPRRSAWTPALQPELAVRNRPQAQQQAPYKLLVVEDDEDLQTVLAKGLEGFSAVQVVATVAQARAAMATNIYDLTILDLELPDGSGLDLLDGFTPGSNGRLPVVVFSGKELDAKTAARVEYAQVKSRDDVSVLVEKVKDIIRSIRGQYQEEKD